MQRCPYCGQLNDDFEERCAYCGELLYIQVEHDDNLSDDKDNDINHIYAAKIAQELIDDEKKRQEKLKNQRADLNSIDKLDDLDDFARELLSPEPTIDDVSEEEDMDIYYRDNKSVQEPDDAVFDDDLTYQNNKTGQKNKSFRHEPSFRGDYGYLNNNITYTKDTTYPEETPAPLIEETHEEKIENEPDEINTDDFISDEDLGNIEDNLKKKIRRNKKLENKLGLTFHDIDLSVFDINDSVLITGKVSINKNLGDKSLQLSVVCFDNDNKEINRSNTIISVDKLFTYVDFKISLKIDINRTNILIMLPEIVDKKPQKVTKQPEKINKNSKKIKKSNPTINKEVHPENSIFIEQMRDIEHKIGIKIDNTSILIKSPNTLDIVGEIYIKDPDKYDKLKIAATCYDENNKIIATNAEYINTKLYLGFDTLNVKISDVDVKKVIRVRLYPTFQ